MPDLTAKRTLVKSPPELWEELSEVERLAKHLGAFGEIKITKLEPEHTVAWEGEHASGTVSIEPSGWGTKVTLHAELSEEPPAAEAEPVAEIPKPEPIAEKPESVLEEPTPVAEKPEPAPPQPEAVTEEPEPVADAPAAEPVAEDPEVETPARRGFWGWLFRTRTESRALEPEAVEAEPVAVEPEPVPVQPEPVPVQPEPVPVQPEPVPVQPEPEPVAVEPLAVESEPQLDASDEDAPLDPERAMVVLDEALDALGAAHHRPFSRG